MKDTLDSKLNSYDSRLSRIEHYLGLRKIKSVKRAIHATRKGHRLSPEQRENLMKDVKEGKISPKNIAAKYSVVPNTVYAIRAKLHK